ncbi:MAG: ABC transporter substrate-binding protein [Sulfobacillus sp.]
MMKRIHFTKPLALLASLGLLVTGVGGGSAAAATGGATASGTLTIQAPSSYNPAADWNPYSPNSTVSTGVGVIAFAPLAIPSNTNRDLGNYYYGQLASSWGYTNNYHRFVVHLRPNLKWNNGTALTSNDVKTSWELYGLQGVWNALGITSITTPDATTIVFNISPTALYSAAREQSILTPTIVPASLYQKFLPSPQEFQRIILNQEHPLPPSASKVATTQASKANALDTQLVKALQAYNPGQSGLVTAGPYEVTGFSPSEVDLKKNPYNWAAANVHVENVVMRNVTSMTATQNGLVSGAFDVVVYQPTTSLYNATMSRGRPYTHYVKPQGFRTLMGSMFSARAYPFNLIQVRQAFEYLLNRKTISTIADPVAGEPVAIPAGVPDSVLQAYLTSAQIKTLNPYNYSPAKAAQLLLSAHFTQKGGKWYLPNGKPFTVTVYSTAGLASWNLMAS